MAQYKCFFDRRAFADHLISRPAPQIETTNVLIVERQRDISFANQPTQQRPTELLLKLSQALA